MSKTTQFKQNQIVHCLLNGKGKIKEVSREEHIVVVEFNNNTVCNYTDDGKMIISGNPVANVSLFADEPYIVTNKALFDAERNIINDKDLVIVGKKNSFIFTAGFYDAKNNSLFTKNGERETNSIFNAISNDTFILKIDTESLKIEEIKDNLKETENTGNYTDKTSVTIPEEYSNLIYDDTSAIPVVESSSPQNNETQNIENVEESNKKEIAKTAEENANYSVPLTFPGAKIIEILPSNAIIQTNDDTCKIKDTHKHAKITFEKDIEYGVKTVVSIGGDADHIAKMSLTDTKPSDYIQVYDAFIIKPGIRGQEDEYLNVPFSDVRFTKKDDFIEITIGN